MKNKTITRKKPDTLPPSTRKRSSTKKSISDHVEECKVNAIEKGFYDHFNLYQQLLMIHGEVSEALEADREKPFYSDYDMHVINGWKQDEDFIYDFKKKIKGTFQEEMADIVLRVMTICGKLDIDLEGHIEAKKRYNSLRKYKHGKRY